MKDGKNESDMNNKYHTRAKILTLIPAIVFVLNAILIGVLTAVLTVLAMIR